MVLQHKGVLCLQQEGVHPSTMVSFEALGRGKRRALIFS